MTKTQHKALAGPRTYSVGRPSLLVPAGKCPLFDFEEFCEPLIKHSHHRILNYLNLQLCILYQTQAYSYPSPPLLCYACVYALVFIYDRRTGVTVTLSCTSFQPHARWCHFGSSKPSTGVCLHPRTRQTLQIRAFFPPQGAGR